MSKDKKIYMRLSNEEAKILGLKLKFKNLTNTDGNPKYRITFEEKDVILKLRNKGIAEACDNLGVSIDSPKFVWIKNKNYSIPAQNPFYKPKEQKELLDSIESSMDKIISKYKDTVPIKEIKRVETKNNNILKVIITDSHVGMDVNVKNGIFNYVYNAEVYKQSLEKVFISIKKEFYTYGTFDSIIIEDLGDCADGWNGYTTRGDHQLQQNMTNDEVFDVCVDSKVKLLKNLVESSMSKNVVLRSVSNDNHSGDFGLIINKAIQKIINVLYNSNVVKVDILTKFLEHRTYGNHCFIFTHGKDKTYMFKGLPFIMTDRVINFINDYIDHYAIDSKYIHVEKGDLHRIGYQRTKKFDYRNFMSFAPPSAWIQHNFGDHCSGYSVQVVPKYCNEISQTDYFLDYRKVLK